VIPSKIFEAMSMAKPILLGVEGFAADLVQRAGAGVCIEPDNARVLADAVEHLADHPELGQAYGVAGQAFVRTHFNWDNLAQKYLEIVGTTIESWKASRQKSGRR
jgi:glycosyltransferase involved in cell wall biosynthesis